MSSKRILIRKQNDKLKDILQQLELLERSVKFILKTPRLKENQHCFYPFEDGNKLLDRLDDDLIENEELYKEILERFDYIQRLLRDL